jgi:hypothetical protein
MNNSGLAVSFGLHSCYNRKAKQKWPSGKALVPNHVLNGQEELEPSAVKGPLHQTAQPSLRINTQIIAPPRSRAKQLQSVLSPSTYLRLTGRTLFDSVSNRPPPRGKANSIGWCALLVPVSEANSLRRLRCSSCRSSWAWASCSRRTPTSAS